MSVIFIPLYHKLIVKFVTYSQNKRSLLDRKLNNKIKCSLSLFSHYVTISLPLGDNLGKSYDHVTPLKSTCHLLCYNFIHTIVTEILRRCQNEALPCFMRN